MLQRDIFLNRFFKNNLFTKHKFTSRSFSSDRNLDIISDNYFHFSVKPVIHMEFLSLKSTQFCHFL